MSTRDAYGFSPLVAHLIPKPKGGNRVICVPTVRDRIVQRAISDYLADGDKCGLDNDVSYGFIPGLSVAKAAAKSCELRVNKQWAYKTDISRFFDNIPRAQLERHIVRFVRERSLQKIIIAASHCEISETSPERQRKIAQAGISKNKGVRQGMPLSPFFANLILREFDSAVKKANIPMVRYADDLIAFASSEAECNNIHELFVRELDRVGLEVPPPGTDSKTQFFAPNDIAEFLGLGIRRDGSNYIIEILPDQVKKLRQKIIDSASFESLTKRGVTLANYVKYLDGVIAGFSGAYECCTNYKDLESVLDGCRSDAITQVLSVGLGINVAGLRDDQKIFLDMEI